MSDIEELKSEAASLGIKHNAQIGADKLQDKIDAYYESQETSGPAVAAAVVEKEKEKPVSEKQWVTGGSTPHKNTKRVEREKNAKKTRVVIIVDNDQRQNNHTSTCTVNCSNEFFDLGTCVLPLNEKIEVAQGHINVLKEVMIPLHTHNTKTGLSATKLRSRFNISYEDNH